MSRLENIFVADGFRIDNVDENQHNLVVLQIRPGGGVADISKFRLTDYQVATLERVTRHYLRRKEVTDEPDALLKRAEANLK